MATFGATVRVVTLGVTDLPYFTCLLAKVKQSLYRLIPGPLRSRSLRLPDY
jgi:hypothetical protein